MQIRLRASPLCSRRRCAAFGKAERPSVCLSWETSVLRRGRDQPEFFDRHFSRLAVETENVSCLQPASDGWRPTEPGDRFGDILLAVHPSAQFLRAVLMHNSHLIFATVLVRHAFSS